MGDISRPWEKNKNRTIEKFFERAGGTAEGKPHSTREGRIAAGKRGFKRYVQSLPKSSLGPTRPKTIRGPEIKRPKKRLGKAEKSNG
jgi:hypothetical protein